MLPHGSDGMPDVYVAHCPERVLPGRIMIEMVTNDRVVGGLTPRCAEQAAAVYRVFSQGEILLTDAASAEMAKLVENAYRDVNIAFANELSLICERPRARRVGGHPARQPPPAGQHPHARPGRRRPLHRRRPVVHRRRGARASRLIRTAREVNDASRTHVAEQVAEKAARFHDPTDRLPRASPSRPTSTTCARARPSTSSPRSPRRCPTSTSGSPSRWCSELPAALAGYTNVRLDGAVDAIAAADIVVLLVDHDHFKALNRSLLAGKVVYDTRGAWR